MRTLTTGRLGTIAITATALLTLNGCSSNLGTGATAERPPAP